MNFLIVLVPLLFYHTIFSSSITRLKEQIKFGTICGIASVLCMQFPIVFGETFFWDLRWIPFIASIIFGGRIPGVITGVFLLVFRYFLGGFIAWLIVLAVAIILFATFMWLRKTYQKLTLGHKLAFGFCSALYTYLLTFSGVYIYFLHLDNLAFIYNQGIALYIMMSASYVITLTIFIYFTEKFMINLKIQENVHQAEKLNLISELAASMAHEVRNPLTVVRGFNQLLRDKLGEHEKEYIDISIKELDRAERIITDYLSFAKPHLDTNGELQVNLILHEILVMITPFANMHEVELSTRMEENITVQGDIIKFKQVLLNLLKNAIEATKNRERGTVHIAACNKNNFVQITISDNGVGMSPAELERIGKPFYTTKTKGTGLGMMVSMRLLDALNGTIQIHSTVLKGTQVVIFLPAASPAQN